MTGIPADVIRAARASRAKWRIPASVSIAQWILESTSGKAMPPGSNNPFGIKEFDPKKPHVDSWTHETTHGVYRKVNQPFAKFATLTDAFDAHGRLLATSHYYVSARTHEHNPDAFAKALQGIYATGIPGHPYGEALIALMRQHNLYQYDIVAPPGTEEENKDMAKTPTPAPATPAMPLPPVPTVSSSIEIDWGSWLSQLAKHAAPIIRAVGEAGEAIVIKAIPFGSIIDGFLGPKIVDQYIDEALVIGEGWLDKQKITVTTTNPFYLYLLNKLKNSEPGLMLMLEGNVESLIKDRLAAKNLLG